jgi:large subunit ribosomal protein L23
MSVQFNTERLMTILLAPVISEKSTMVADTFEQVVFKVVPSATKPEVKAAVELMFKVQVESVSILNVKGKQKRFGQTMGRRSDVRKAYVSLKPGQQIDFQSEVK